MGTAGRKLGALILTVAACGSGALAGLALASPDARIATTQKPSTNHKAKRWCMTRRRKGHPPKRVRCHVHHHPAAAKLPAGRTAPVSSSTTSTGTVPTTTPSVPTVTPAPVGGGETPITPKPPEVPRVQVTSVEYAFSLSRTTVPAGKIILEFDNKGQDEHNLNVLSGGGELSSSFANEQPGGVTQETVDLKPGSYMLFCSLPEHEAKGMKASLVVE